MVAKKRAAHLGIFQLRFILPAIGALLFIVMMTFFSAPCSEGALCDNVFWWTVQFHLVGILLIRILNTFLPRIYVLDYATIWIVGIITNYFMGIVIEHLYQKLLVLQKRK